MIQALKDLAKRLTAEKGIQPPREGEARPVGYYMVSHVTGEPIVPHRRTAPTTAVTPE